MAWVNEYRVIITYEWVPMWGDKTKHTASTTMMVEAHSPEVAVAKACLNAGLSVRMNITEVEVFRIGDGWLGYD